MAESSPVLIAGGGIGGLTLAVALARRGTASTVLERRSEFSDQGAGIQLGPNATGLLRQLGIAPLLEPLAGQPRCLRMRSGSTGRTVAELPLGAWIARRHGDPYWVAHRNDLQAALLQAVDAAGRVELVMGAEVASFAPAGNGVEVAAGGRTFRGRVLVGADGLHSTVRRLLWPAARLRYSGMAAARALVAAASAPAAFADPHVGLWMAPFGHAVHYPVRGGRDIAVVAVLAEPWPGEGWSLAPEPGEMARRLTAFAAPLAAFLALAAGWRKWALYEAPVLPHWSAGPITLLGDAAHPVLPFLAQGGALAIEDAAVLAGCLAEDGDGAAAVRRYERLRYRRARQVQTAARRSGRIYHLAGAAALARDLALGTAPGPLLMGGWDWVYGWRPAPARRA